MIARMRSALVALALTTSITANAQGPVPPLPLPRDSTLPTVFHIGDSTVRNGSGNGANGQWGWGDMTSCWFDTTKVNVVNRAIGGRSSRTYLTQGQWDRVLAMLKPGDVVTMQFGHNDGGAVNDTSRARGTLRGIGEETDEIDNLLTHQREVVHSFGWYLRRYIADTRARGATPIVASLVPRNYWENGKVRRDSASFGGWAAQVARAEGVAFLDLNDLVARMYDVLGEEEVKGFFVSDRTHTTLMGAQLNAQLAIYALKLLPQNPLASVLVNCKR